MICVGQSTTDDAYTNEIDGLRATLTNSVARIAQLEGHLAAAVDEITKLKEKLKSLDSKFSILIFTALRYVSVVYAMALCQSVRL